MNAIPLLPPRRSAEHQAGMPFVIDAVSRGRARRVNLLIIAMVIMGLVDLALTLTYMTSIGMFEVNPIARQMVDLGASRQLVMYKLLTVGISCGAIFMGRYHRVCEICAWCCTIGLLALMAHWVDYNTQLAADPDHFITLSQGATLDDDFVLIKSSSRSR